VTHGHTNVKFMLLMSLVDFSALRTYEVG